MPWKPDYMLFEAYSHARKLYIETGDLDAFDNMLRHVTLTGDYWKIMGDDPNICNPAWNVDITVDLAGKGCTHAGFAPCHWHGRHIA